MNRVIHTPEGVRDIYGDEFDEREELTGRLFDTIRSYGYKGTDTPTFEFFDVFSKEIGTTPSKDLYKFFDREGNTLVLRPDFTPSMCRLAAAHFSEKKEPVRLTYSGSVFSNSHSYRGRLNEFPEVGAELLFDGSSDADAEIISCCIDCLRASGLTDFKIGVGHADVLKGLIEYGGLSEDEEIVRNFIDNHNFYGLREFLSEKNADNDISKLFTLMESTFDTVSQDDEMYRLSENYPVVRAAIERFIELQELLKVYGTASFVSFDPGLISHYRYYTGIIFTGFAYGTGEPVISGGRYDRLMDSFGCSGEAVGFAVFTDELYSALKNRKISLGSAVRETVIEYTENDRQDAIKKAMELRQTGTRVTLKKKAQV